MSGLEFANSPVVWIFASAIIALVIFQAIKFLSLSKKVAKKEGFTDQEIGTAIKTGLITAIGPSVGIIIVAVSLISLIGNPLTMMRIGVIGSAPIELMGAQLSAESAGVELAGNGFTPEMFNLVVWTLCIGGAGWMIVTFFATPYLSKVQEKISAKKGGSAILGIIATGALIGVFGSLTTAEMLKGNAHIFTAIVAIAVSSLITYIAAKTNKGWLKEWSLGISILVSLVAVYFII